MKTVRKRFQELQRSHEQLRDPVGLWSRQLELSRDTVGSLLGDVAGTSFPAGSIALYVKGLFDEAARRHTLSGRTAWIDETLKEMNHKLSDKGIFGRFVVLVIRKR